MTVVDLVRLDQEMSQTVVFVFCIFCFWMFTSCGQLFDGRPSVWKSEFVRSSVMLVLHETVAGPRGMVTLPLMPLRAVLSSSILLSLSMIVAGNEKWAAGNGNGEEEAKKKVS